MENLNSVSAVETVKTANVVSAKKENSKTKRTNAKKDKSAKTDIPVLSLDKLNAIGITDRLKDKSEKKKIFKSEFNNKADRSKCRDKFFNYVSLFLLQLAHNKKDIAQ